jgi:hypothetical protein
MGLCGFRKGYVMDTKTSDKLVRFGRTLDIVGKILAVFCLLAAMGSLGCLIVVLVLPEGFVLGLFDSVDISRAFSVFQPGTVLRDLVPSAAVYGVKIAAIWGTFKAFLYCLISAIILFSLSAVFNSTASKRSPFLPENVKRLKIVGVILIVTSLFLGLDNLIFAFCVLALAFMFQYGTELQQQADETL